MCHRHEPGHGGRFRGAGNAWAIIPFLLLVGAVPSASAADIAEPFIERERAVFELHGTAYYRLPSLLVTGRGTVLAACQKRLGKTDDFAPSSLVIRRSRDGGRTFDEEQTLFERAGHCTFNGNLVEDRQTGTLLACFIVLPQAEGPKWFSTTWTARGGGFSLVRSADDGRTWSAPVEVMPHPNAEGWHGGGAFNNNHGIQLRRGPHAGRLVIGARVFKPGVYEGRAKGGVLYSDDHGQTWQVGGVPFKDDGGINSEVTVGETAAGELYVNFRNSTSEIPTEAADRQEDRPDGLPAQRRLYARSRDGGESFHEEGCHIDLFDPPCNAGLAAYPWPTGDSEELLLFTAPARRQRTHLTVYTSGDGGRHWTAGNVISKRAGGYSDVAVLDDRTILTLYEDRGTLLLARFNLTWLLGE